MKNDLDFIKETLIDLASRIPWLGLALAVAAAVIIAAPWLSN